ncbi:uncharacterized protein FOMMEDRAFT_161474 [Fomitiporia mediterranea MF3/22]|uniref:uncharacterized protein n=1 Tax=Fomitiporia mediterranea (strain MF3/22) TaxID=694068 RepID=UPI0004408A1F|nr:uncharacterized protein FOMMEDRAFT_161474 [Fomitiporia mediterranea MF3/22]EJC98647.1 hypothetical protein FOMMEDRAFT_161474 [Fomitiporia mediterranea MF3/22]
MNNGNASGTPPPTLPEDQLLELLTQLQRTTPEQAKAILNAQPTIGYALVPLMVKMGIVNLEVLQKTLSSYAAPASNQTAPPPVPTIPAHLIPSQSQPQAQVQAHQPPYGHQPTPPPAVAPYPLNPTAPAPQYPGYAQNGGYTGQQQQQQYGGQQHPTQQQPAVGQTSGPNAAMLGALGNIPDDQREMIMRVISMTPDQINRLPPQDRAITIQLRTTLGLPTE